MITYRNSGLLTPGDTKKVTVAFGTIALRKNGVEFVLPVECKGVAKLCPTDNYDANVGIKIASARAEIQGRKFAENALKEYKTELEKQLVSINSDLEKSAGRREHLESIIQGYKADKKKDEKKGE